MGTRELNGLLEKRLLQVRQLKKEDQELLNEFLAPQLSKLESRGIDTDVYTGRLVTYLNNSEFPNRKLFGYFDESQRLTSIMSLLIWSSMPFATLSYMFVRAGAGLFNADRNGLNLCLHRCLDEGEKHGAKAFYSLQRANSFKHKARTWRKNDTPITKEYYSVPELYIPANTTTQYSIIWDVMDRQTWPYDTILWVTRLKPEYETKLNWG